MRKTLAILLLPALLATSGCSLFRSGDTTPDEFAVARNAPLVIPPDFTLTPPVAGTAGLSATDAQAQAIEALFGGPAPRSASEIGMLDKAGRDRAALGARSTAGDPGTRIVDKGQTTVAILNAPEADSQIASAQVPQ